jgi:hypothetical protein
LKAPLLRARANDVGDPELLDVAGDPKQLVKLIAIGIFTGGTRARGRPEDRSAPGRRGQRMGREVESRR